MMGHGTNGGARRFTYLAGQGEDGEPVFAEAIEPDMAALTDKPHELMAEEFGIPLAAAARIQAWHERTVHEAALAGRAEDIGKLIAFLMQPSGNLQGRLLGVVYSFGLATRLNGFKSMRQMAPGLGCTPALISHYKRECDKLFESTIGIFGKPAASRAKFSEMRREFVRTGLTKKERAARAAADISNNQPN